MYEAVTDKWAYEHHIAWRRDEEDREQVGGLCSASTLTEVMMRSLLDCRCRC